MLPVDPIADLLIASEMAQHSRLQAYYGRQEPRKWLSDPPHRSHGATPDRRISGARRHALDGPGALFQPVKNNQTAEDCADCSTRLRSTGTWPDSSIGYSKAA